MAGGRGAPAELSPSTTRLCRGGTCHLVARDYQPLNMDEVQIKAEVLNLIRSQSTRRRRPVVATEFQILKGQTRADLAILDDEFIGVEIKSKKDTLKRLVKQTNDYRNCFDRTVLVLDESHLLAYLGIKLPFCDVWTFDENKNLRQFSEGRHERVPDENLYRMLTLKEREMAFRDARFSGWSQREIFLHFFKLKFGPTSDQFWKSVGRRKILRHDIQLLSRFREIRLKAEKNVAARDEEWAAWLQAQNIEP
ncbi:hypothetical protein A6F68_02012 [Tsuneonella dongtanensis]|uniref:Uncharacterized protein n=1 Tax=Tsuneonella dongtanensis TaxID=692370 RepID=A0A1B2AEC8_9SPHN|nr:sce7726 family protein [Tsuneonella dongtanensis]ANY20520.1 hypothetical protein A6F68_02012 [Tsuneonella dongtanensis]